MVLLTVTLMGGIGNQLFQIATAYTYAKKHGIELLLVRDWDCQADRPPVWKGYLDSNKWNTCSRGEFHILPWTLVSEQGFHYSLINSPNSIEHIGFIRLYGYFQSSKYFSEYAEELRELLKPPIENMMKAKNLNCDGWTAAHVRRGDYVNATPYHLVCSPAYYTGSRSTIDTSVGKESPVCWITDDTTWVQEHLVRPGDMVISGDSIDDFTILMRFKNMILSNSSFSWWAAWLNPEGHTDRKICCPNRWFGPLGPSNYESVFESDWLRIDTNSGNLIAQL